MLVLETPPYERRERTNMDHKDKPVHRRTALKRGAVVVVSTIAIGVPAMRGTAVASGIPQMVVDAPPAISANPNGRVTAAIYPGKDTMSSSDVKNAVEAIPDGRFKFGPDDGAEAFDMHAQADSVGWRLVNNGVHGEALGVFFDSSTADAEGSGWWSDPDDDRGAKLSAVKGAAAERDDIIAWGADEEVTITPIRLELS